MERKGRKVSPLAKRKKEGKGLLSFSVGGKLGPFSLSLQCGRLVVVGGPLLSPYFFAKKRERRH